MKYFLGNKSIHINPKQLIGQGGEADIYKLNNNDVIKLFKTPQHPAFAKDISAQKAAQLRIEEHQHKLQQFPQGLPQNILAPRDLIRDGQGKIVGYTMPYLKDAQPLYRYGDRRFREQYGIDHNQVIQIFSTLHHTIKTLHQKDIVIGDFNDLNILILQTNPFLIDTDSWQFNQFKCRVFTARFVDPCLCDKELDYLELQNSYNQDSDWYSYSLMLFRCLLYVELYGGIYIGNNANNLTGKIIPQLARPLHRINVFNPQVKYPKPALHYRVLRDDMVHYYQQLSEQDLRGEFPLKLLHQLQWKSCHDCGQIHCRQHCPDCHHKIYPISLAQISGQKEIFTTTGSILATSFSDHYVAYLYWEGGYFKRETGEVVFQGDRHPSLQFWLTKEATYVGQENTILCFTQGELQREKTLQVDRYRQQSCMQVLGNRRYWLHQGKLWRDGTLGREYIGDVLPDQSYFWLGENLGFGIYQMGHWLNGFLFNPHRRGINDQVKLPPIPGEIIAMNCVISQDVWLFISAQYQGNIQQYLYGIDPQGQGRSPEIFAVTTIPKIEGHGATPAGLLVTTDQGLSLWSRQHNQVVKQPWAESYNGLVTGHQNVVQTSSGVYLYDHRRIYRLDLQGT